MKSTKRFVQLEIIFNTFLFYLLQLLDVSITAFASLVGILKEITNSAIGLKLVCNNSGIKKYKSKLRKKEAH